MHIASATTRTGYVARGIAGKEAASCVHSHQTAASDILFGGHFYDHVACGIASGQGGTRIRLTCHAADIDRSLHCGRGAASGDGTAYFLTSSLRHPKIFIKEFGDFLMPCHQHCLSVYILVQR